MRQKFLTMVLLLTILVRPMLVAGDVIELNKEQKELKKEISEVTDKIIEYENQIADIKEEIEENNKQIKALEDQQKENQEKIEQSREDLDTTMVMMQRVNNKNTIGAYFYDENTENNNYFLRLENINIMFTSVTDEMTAFVDEIKNVQDDIDKINELTKDNEKKLKEIDDKIEKQVKLEADLKQELVEVEKELGQISLNVSGTSSSSEREAIMAAAGVSPDDYQYVNFIIAKESGWNATAANPVSSAYGLCQSLPGSKMASAGSDWQTNPITQMKWCNNYAVGRYGSWEKAYNFWISNHWW